MAIARGASDVIGCFSRRSWRNGGEMARNGISAANAWQQGASGMAAYGVGGVTAWRLKTAKRMPRHRASWRQHQQSPARGMAQRRPLRARSAANSSA